MSAADPDRADVVIVGAGIAGAAAALEVASAGRSFLLVDRLPEFGGTAITSGGGCCIAGTELQRRNGIHDSPELAIRDLLAAGGERADPAWAAFYFHRAAHEVHDWLVGHGVEFQFLRAQEDNSVPRWHAVRGFGRGIMDALRAALQVCGLDDAWRPSVVVDDLVWEDGRVAGVVAGDEHGASRTFRGEAVVMATGGFAGNLEMVRAHVPALGRVDRLMIGGGRGAQGDGHRLLARHGAQLTNMESVWAYAYATPDPRDPAGRRGLVIRGTEQGIWVNGDGLRFHDEGRNGPGSATPALLAQDPPGCWAILDRPMLSQLRVSDPYFRGDPFIPADRLAELVARSPWVVEGSTIADLAARAGLDAAGLDRTVTAWNQLLGSGAQTDPLTGRALAGVAPLGVPPFYAITFLPLVRKNLGGVRTDLRGHVLDGTGAPIPGLYGAGELCGLVGGHLAGAKALEGIMLGASLFSGRVAGAWAAHDAGAPEPARLDARLVPAPDGA